MTWLFGNVIIDELLRLILGKSKGRHGPFCTLDSDMIDHATCGDSALPHFYS